MLKKKQKFVLGGVKFTVDPKKPHVLIEVNGVKYPVSKNELWSMVFSFSKKKKQDALIPVVQQEMVPFMKQVWIKATKDIKAGEFISAHIQLSIPLEMAKAELSKEQREELLNTDPNKGHDIPSPFVHTDEKGV